MFVLVRLEGLPYEEVARIARGLRLGTVKSRLAAAEAALRRRLAPARASSVRRASPRSHTPRVPLPPGSPHP